MSDAGGSYDPATSPFELPIAVRRVWLCFEERPLLLTPREGANLTTTLRGLFLRSLLRAGCEAGASRGACIARTGDHADNTQIACSRPETCPVAWLHPRRSLAQRRDHPSPVILHPLGLAEEGHELILELILWGRQAVGREGVVRRAMRIAGETGLLDNQGPLLFRVKGRDLFDGTLGDWCELFQADLPDPLEHLLVGLQGPFSGRPDIKGIIKNAALQLVRWDLEDRGWSERLGKQGCDELADAVSEAAARSLDGVEAEAVLKAARGGFRRSLSTGADVPLAGVEGGVELRGPLKRALPWLIVLATHGGPKRSWGLSQVELIVPER